MPKFSPDAVASVAAHLDEVTDTFRAAIEHGKELEKCLLYIKECAKMARVLTDCSPTVKQILEAQLARIERVLGNE